MNGPADRREGMALLVVLLLVAVMSVLAMGVLDDIRFGMRRAHNSETMAQARWFALGSEDLAKVRLRAINKGEITNISGDWANQDMTFPIDDGVMRATLRDGGNCFNLNSVVEGKGDFLQLRNEGVAQFMSLLTALKVSEPHARELSFALVDWMDTDRAELGSGGEDSTYSRLDPPYRTSQTLLAEPSELKVIRGFTPEIYKTLRPFV
jgi:general secretion pathway protein K